MLPMEWRCCVARREPDLSWTIGAVLSVPVYTPTACDRHATSPNVLLMQAVDTAYAFSGSRSLLANRTIARHSLHIAWTCLCLAPPVLVGASWSGYPMHVVESVGARLIGLFVAVHIALLSGPLRVVALRCASQNDPSFLTVITYTSYLPIFLGVSMILGYVCVFPLCSTQCKPRL